MPESNVFILFKDEKSFSCYGLGNLWTKSIPDSLLKRNQGTHSNSSNGLKGFPALNWKRMLPVEKNIDICLVYCCQWLWKKWPTQTHLRRRCTCSKFTLDGRRVFACSSPMSRCHGNCYILPCFPALFSPLSLLDLINEYVLEDLGRYCSEERKKQTTLSVYDNIHQLANHLALQSFNFFFLISKMNLTEEVFFNPVNLMPRHQPVSAKCSFYNYRVSALLACNRTLCRLNSSH